MKFIIDTTSIEALNATGEQIKAEISRIEAESKTAREKGTAKTTQVQKKNKKKDILVDEVEYYEALLHLANSVAGFKSAITKRQKREAAAKEAQEDERIFEEALNAENEMVAKSQELDDERHEINEAFEDVQRLEGELAAKQERLDASRERLPGVFEASEAANRAQEESQKAILSDNSEPSLIESFKVDKEQADRASDLASERREVHEAYVDVEETKEDLAKARERLAESRKRIAEKFAAVERAKAEAARTAARLDERFAPIHEAEAVTHDKKADFFDLNAGKTFNREEPVVSEDEAAKAKLRSNLASVIQARIDQLNKEDEERLAQEAKKVEDQVKPVINDMPEFNPVNENGAYGLKKDQIVQDLPINSKEDQSFKTPGMTPEQIKESQDKLAAVPMKDGKATPTVSWVEMKERINTLMLKKEMDDKNLSPDDIYALYYLRTHPEAAPSKEFIKDLLIWAGIAPLERVTPRTTGPAPIQEEPVKKDSAIVATPEHKDIVPVEKKEEPVHDMTDKEIEETAAELKKQGEKAETPDMTDKEIEETEAELNGTKDGREIPAHPDDMTDEEIDAIAAELDGKGKKPAAEDDSKKGEPKKEEPKKEEPKKEEPKKKEKKEKYKGKRVKKREPFTSAIKKRFLVLKGLMFGEKLNDKSDDYTKAVIAISQLKANYKKNDPATNKAAIESINDIIKNGKDLTHEDNRRLYGKLVKLSKKIDKFQEKHKVEASAKTGVGVDTEELGRIIDEIKEEEENFRRR